MRFGLTSALMGNAFYSFDYGDDDHGQTWRYDEYEVSLGQPTGAPMLASKPSVQANAPRPTILAPACGSAITRTAWFL